MNKRYKTVLHRIDVRGFRYADNAGDWYNDAGIAGVRVS
jgi:hypothetical protein